MKEIEISELRKLTAYLRDNFNHDFSEYALSSFKRRIVRILDLHRIESVDSLIHKLGIEKDYFKLFLSEVTVNVTEMFRDPSFWKALRDNIFPNLLQNHDKIRIWHAGCSSGEEVFSMAILLKELEILDKAIITATDIDQNIINSAKSGRYKMKNMDINNKNYIRFNGIAELSNYYNIDGDYAIFDPTLIENVTFREHNLVNGEPFSKFDLILCRNVMIYFNQSLQNQVLKTLHESMFKYSYLCIGSKESLIWCEISNKFLLVNGEEKVYKKLRD